MWNYFLVKWICEALKTRLSAYRIGEIFSQNKDEIILGFYKDGEKDFYWTLNLDPILPHMRFSDSFSRAKKNSADLFESLYDLKIEKIVMHEYERSFHFILERNYRLVFKLHGNLSNVILIKNSKNTLFRTQIKNDLEFQIPAIGQGEVSFQEYEKDPDLKKHFRVFDKRILKTINTEQFKNSSPVEQWERIHKLMQVLKMPVIYLFKENDRWQLHQLPPDSEFQKFTDPFEASNAYASIAGKDDFLTREKNKVTKAIENQIRKITQARFNMQERLDVLVNYNDWEQNANLIMANLHVFSNGKTEAEIFDFYANENRILKIKQGQSPQKFAENLYKKSKNKEIEIRNLKNSIQLKNQQEENLKAELKIIAELNDTKAMKDFIKSHERKGVGNEQDSATMFKEFSIDGYDIYVGRNAKNNDLLTTKFAKKDDLWMHAKDVSGSHLVIRKKGTEKIPNNVLEKAASIAAWYSKGKNDTLFPVLYTERKYVRKGKGLAPGKVLVDKYDVLIVKPELP